MPESHANLEEFIRHVTEGLAVELKSWIDPDMPEGKAIIVKAALAMRNHGGGFFLIGFDDKTGKPVAAGRPLDIRQTYSKDKLATVIGKYASEKFDFELSYVMRDGAEYPVLQYPAGIINPVACKSDLKVLDGQGGERFLLRADEIYVRTLNTNNTPSSARANWKDWPALMNRCFDNREADIGRFVRRHLAGLSPKSVRQLSALMTKPPKETPSSEQLFEQILYTGSARDAEYLRQRNIVLPELGTIEAVFFGRGVFPKKHRPDIAFLDLVKNANPQYHGWPFWLDGRAFVNEQAKPLVYREAWESHRINLSDPQRPRHVEFVRLDPTGRFYQKRGLLEDLPMFGPLPQFRFLDIYAQARNVADAILTGISIAHTLEAKEKAVLRFGFRWEGLQGRKLASDDPNLIIVGDYEAVQNDVKKLIRVPMATAPNAISPFILQVIEPLANAFAGATVRLEAIEVVVDRLINRKVG